MKKRQIMISAILCALSLIFLILSIVFVYHREKVPMSLYLKFETDAPVGYIDSLPFLTKYEKVTEKKIVKKYEAKRFRIDEYVEDKDNRIDIIGVMSVRLVFMGKNDYVYDVDAFAGETELPVSIEHGDFILDTSSLFGVNTVTVKGRAIDGVYTYVFVINVEHSTEFSL